jgi:hypothetical protein
MVHAGTPQESQRVKLGNRELERSLSCGSRDASALLITPISAEHVEAVARLHCSCLKGLLSQLGRPAARAFYGGCVKTQSAVGLVCVDAGAVRGFVLGSATPDQLKTAVPQKNVIALLAGLCWGIVRRPIALAWLPSTLFCLPERAACSICLCVRLRRSMK